MGTLSSPALSDTRTAVRRFLNQESSTNSYWSDAELDSYINEAVRIYMAELLQLGEGHFVKQADLDLVEGADAVSAPSDFFKVRSLYKKVNAGYELLAYDNNVTSGRLNQQSSGPESFLPSYYIRNNLTIILSEPAGFSQTDGLRLDYIALPDTLDADGDTLPADISALFKQCVEMYAVYKAKVKESLNAGSDTMSIVKAHVSELTSQFKDAIQIRSQTPTYIVPFNPGDY